MQSLRGSFRKELKKVIDSQRSGRGTEDLYKSSLWYFDYMLFTKDQEVPTNSISNIDEDLKNEIISDENLHHDVLSPQEEENTVGGNEQQNKIAEATPTEAATPQRNKRKATTNYQAEFYKVCSDTIISSNKELSEFDVAGINMAKKLAKMDPLQAIYAESIINNVLRRGLLKKLTDDTDICDNFCNKNIQRAYPTTSSHSRSSYESPSLVNQYLPSTSSETRDTEENINLA
ncbi:unnamed protein product [Colias eurytheme]|nr:unnamed protein product [Colias eurytheme]